MAWTRAFLLRTTRETLRMGVNAAIKQMEDTGLFGVTDRLKRGELNAWFGYLSAVFQLLDASDWDGIAGKLRLGGDADAMNFLLAGSIPQLIDDLSYQAVGLATQALPAPRAGSVSVTSVAPYSSAGGLGTR